MKHSAVILFVFLGLANWIFSQTGYIHVDQFGYQKNAAKVAVLSNPQVGFNSSDSYTPSVTIEVRNSLNNQVVFTGSPVPWDGGSTHLESGDQGWWFDFSSLTANGNYYIHDVANNVSSPSFEIEEEPYREVLRAATKMFYFNRSGFAKTAPAAGSWTDGMSFSNPLQDANCRFISDSANAILEKDLSGGWFDNGSYNKRVSTAYLAVHNLLAAYQKNPTLFTDNWDFPESGNNIPDLLDEVKWELDWVYKMTNPDGSAHIKMGNQNYSDNTSSPPSANTDQRFYGPTCSASSIAAASILAHGALVLADFPALQSYSTQLLARAEACYAYGVSFFNNNNFETNCDDGSIVGGGTDLDVQDQVRGLLSASIYLYGATGTATYQTFLINNGYLVSPLQNNYWSGGELPACDALMYYTTINGANAGMKGSILNSAGAAISNNWGLFYGMNDAGLYRDYMPNWAYYTGSNGRKLRYGVLNIAIANIGAGDSTSLWNKGASILHSMHGVNPLGKVYLTNMGDLGAENSVNEMYHEWFADGSPYDNAQTSPIGPPPGYLVGGPNPYFSVATLTPPYGQPATKSYLDFNDNWPNNSYQVSEPAIYYQSAYVRLLSEIIGYEHATLELESQSINSFRVFPNPTKDKFYVNGIEETAIIHLFDLAGKTVITSLDFEKGDSIDLSTLSPGMYVLKIQTNREVFETRILKE